MAGVGEMEEEVRRFAKAATAVICRCESGSLRERCETCQMTTAREATVAGEGYASLWEGAAKLLVSKRGGDSASVGEDMSTGETRWTATNASALLYIGINADGP